MREERGLITPRIDAPNDSIKRSIEDCRDLLDGSEPLPVSRIGAAHHIKKRLL